MSKSIASTPQRSLGGSTNGTAKPLPALDTVPLLGDPDEQRPRRKPFYRARPLWLVPFAIISSVIRGMTIAPRVQIYTQLSCSSLYGGEWNHTQNALVKETLSSYTTLLSAVDPFAPHIHPATLLPLSSRVVHDSAVPPDVPVESQQSRHKKRIRSCASDPVVQASAARLQTIMTITMGLFSALTSGWWGSFSERHGRTKVLAFSTLGLLLTDLTFLLVSRPSLHSLHSHMLLIMAPVIEGLLGGLSTLHSATSSYLSDCTSSGSRAHIFSLFAGVFYVGFSFGPSMTAYLVQHPIHLLGYRPPVGSNDLSVFWVAIAFSTLNFLMALFVFPESLGKEKRQRALDEYNKTGVNAKGKARMPPPPPDNEIVAGTGGAQGLVFEDVIRVDNTASSQSGTGGIIKQLFRPLAIFLPVMSMAPSGIGRKRRDWSLTLLGAGLFGYTLSTGVFQMKYLYATHIYSWGVQQLSYYISLMGGLRAMFLLLLLPTVIAVFKPKQQAPKVAPSYTLVQGVKVSLEKDKNSKPNRSQLGREISFDITLARFSLIIDIIAHSLVAIIPAPAIVPQGKSHGDFGLSPAQSQTTFVFASALNCFGAGMTPVAHSLALSLIQLRAMDGKNSEVGVKEDETIGELFGALAVLQAVGQTILAPLLFGMIYSNTVAQLPKAIFVMGALLCVFSLAMVSCMRNPVTKGGLPKAKAPLKRRKEFERGRSRMSKDLRGGAIPYYPLPSYGAVAEGVGNAAETV